MGLKISHLLPITMAFKFVIATALLAGFQFDLLLTEHERNCYFIKADDNHDHSDRFLSDEKPLGVFPSPRHAVEAFIRRIIKENSSHKIHPSSISEVLEEFNDVLIKSECRHKNIFRVDFNWDELAMN